MLEAEQRERQRSLQRRLRADVREIRELSDGYAFRYSPEPSVFLTLAEFVALERLCCPFFDFGLEVERNRDSVWFRMTGEEDAKSVLRAELVKVRFVTFLDATLPTNPPQRPFWQKRAWANGFAELFS